MNNTNLVASETLMQELGIKKDAYYRDIKFLNIEIIKDEKGRSYLSEVDAQTLKSLRLWIEKTGKRKGFPNNFHCGVEESNSNQWGVNDSSLISDEGNNFNGNLTNNSVSSNNNLTSNSSLNSNNSANNLTSNSALSINNSQENSQLNTNTAEANSTHNSSLTPHSSDNNSIQNSEFVIRNSEDIYVEPEDPTDNINVDNLVREAAELKAREIAMQSLVKRAIADKLEEDELPEDLQDKINLAREAANPKFTPDMVATTILARYRHSS